MTEDKQKEASQAPDPKKEARRLDEKSERPVLGKIKTDEEARELLSLFGFPFPAPEPQAQPEEEKQAA